MFSQAALFFESQDSGGARAWLVHTISIFCNRIRESAQYTTNLQNKKRKKKEKKDMQFAGLGVSLVSKELVPSPECESSSYHDDQDERL